MKCILFFILFLVFNFANAQDARPLKKGRINNFTQHKKYDAVIHKGKHLSIKEFGDDIYLVLRERVYSEDAIQSTLIFRHRQTEFKAYAYLNFPECSMTYAVSLRLYLNKTYHER